MMQIGHAMHVGGAIRPRWMKVKKIISHFKNNLEDLGKLIQIDTLENDDATLNNWSVEVQLFCVLKLYLTYGVIRSSELMNCLITDNDCDDNTNYINVNKKRNRDQ